MMTNYLPVKLESVYKIPYLIKLCQIVELKRGSFEINKHCHFFSKCVRAIFCSEAVIRSALLSNERHKFPMQRGRKINS